jgi:molecular chaperone GrpE
MSDTENTVPDGRGRVPDDRPTVEMPSVGESTLEMPAVPDPNGRGAAQPNEWLAAFEDQRDKYLRLAAEYDNFRKRAGKERAEAGPRAQAEVIASLVEVLDDISRFAHIDPASTDARTVVDGVSMVEKKAMKALAAHGLELVHPLDQPFDPALHEAVGTEAAERADQDHLVSRVYQAGYVLRGQLLRPARVVVRQWNG